MMNELYQLSAALDNAGIKAQSWHREYGPIPNISDTAPCVRITIFHGEVVGLSCVDRKLGAFLRKYGSKQGSYPCMNLGSLYSITDASIKKALSAIRLENLDAAKLSEIKGWCQKDNWGKDFQRRYKVSMENTTKKLKLLSEVSEYEPLKVLIEESDRFLDPAILHQKLETMAFEMLSRRENVRLALYMLFCNGKSDANISVALESPRLIELGVPAVSEKFVLGLNQALMDADLSAQNVSGSSGLDAFGVQFDLSGKSESMPSVKLAGGFDVTLRTMSKNEPCQTRYGRIEDAGYPISKQMRTKLHTSLNWLGSSTEHENFTWIKTDKDEILFAYPSSLPETKISYTRMFKRSEHTETFFAERAKQFIQELRQPKKAETDTHADQIRIFILRKIDKARTKVVYTRQTDPYELERRSEKWQQGCSNLPEFLFGQPNVPFPLDTADILNRFWKQNGEAAKAEFKPVPKYHGIELLMEPDLSVISDLHVLSEKAMTLNAFLGKLLAERDMHHPIWEKVKDMLALMGLLLDRKGIGKDMYMENLPYLYGQLLKASDELHALYCNVVRKRDIPLQLAGGSLFQSAAEAPIRTLNLLGQRIMPYYTWAKSYRTQGVEEKDKESWRAGWLYATCEETMTKLHDNWTPQTRFNDEEKAQLFIGYLAAFPKKEQRENDTKKKNAMEETSYV